MRRPGWAVRRFVYVPTACQAATERCRLHIAFHGCDQGRSFVGDTFARHSGLSELAEAKLCTPPGAQFRFRLLPRLKKCSRRSRVSDNRL